jgi:predicted branched-subunit amino acid permease
VAAAAALLVNLRNVVYGISAASFLPATPLARALAAHLVNDESVAFALSQPERAARLAAFRILGTAILIAWPLGATTGLLIGYLAPSPGLLGLDAAFPAIFLAILMGSINRATAGPAVVGAAVAVVATPFVAAGIAPILGLNGLLARARKRRPHRG